MPGMFRIIQLRYLNIHASRPTFPCGAVLNPHFRRNKAAIRARIRSSAENTRRRCLQQYISPFQVNKLFSYQLLVRVFRKFYTSIVVNPTLMITSVGSTSSIIFRSSFCPNNYWWWLNHLEKWWSSSMRRTIPYINHQPDITRWCWLLNPKISKISDTPWWLRPAPPHARHPVHGRRKAQRSRSARHRSPAPHLARGMEGAAPQKTWEKWQKLPGKTQKVTNVITPKKVGSHWDKYVWSQWYNCKFHQWKSSI